MEHQLVAAADAADADDAAADADESAAEAALEACRFRRPV